MNRFIFVPFTISMTLLNLSRLFYGQFSFIVVLAMGWFQFACSLEIVECDLFIQNVTLFVLV